MKYIRGCKITPKDIADDFYEAYKRCLELDSNNKFYSIPSFANGFFACELYLKILLGEKVNKIKRNKHNLKRLFKELNKKQKEELQSVKCESEYTLDFLLDKVSDGFTVWRYIYEDGNEEFGDGRPFEYSEVFLKTYLPVLKKMSIKNSKDK